jgi:hypothetical protein
MSNAMKLAPLLTPEEATRLAALARLARPPMLSPLAAGNPPPPRPRLVRSTNGLHPLSPSEIPIPVLVRSTNTPVRTPTPRTPAEAPPPLVLTREDERRRVTREEIEAFARRLW